jgi:type IV secretion system protein VirB6
MSKSRCLDSKFSHAKNEVLKWLLLFYRFGKNIDAMVIDIVATISNNAMDYFLPVVSSGLAMSFIWFGTMCVLGNYDAQRLILSKKSL